METKFRDQLFRYVDFSAQSKTLARKAEAELNSIVNTMIYIIDSMDSVWEDNKDAIAARLTRGSKILSPENAKLLSKVHQLFHPYGDDPEPIILVEEIVNVDINIVSTGRCITLFMTSDECVEILLPDHLWELSHQSAVDQGEWDAQFLKYIMTKVDAIIPLVVPEDPEIVLLRKLAAKHNILLTPVVQNENI